MSPAPFSQADLTKARQALCVAIGSEHVRDSFGTDAIGSGFGASLIVRPATTAEVASVVEICQAHGLGVVAEGGHTGLVGGCLCNPGQILLSLTRMRQIDAIYPDERVAVVEAGVPLEVLQDAALAYGLEPGIDLAARGTATIGGMVSTNAGGIMAHRYGVMRHRVLGMEAVLPDGSIYSDMTRVVKNTAGYDLKHLFIGAEGTLGIVTRVVLKLEPLPQATSTLLLGLPSTEAALHAISLALQSQTGHLRAAEGLWKSYIQLTAAGLGWSEPSLPLDQPLYLLLMLGGATQDALMPEVERIFADLLERFDTVSGLIAGSQRQEAELWRLREDTDLLYRAHVAAPSYDVSVPLTAIAGYIESITAGLSALDGGILPYVFGHLADGNLHIVLDRSGPLDTKLSAAVESVLYPPLRDLGGCFAAEHGVGAKRVAALIATADPVKLATMVRIKQALDPSQIMNPGKVLRRQPPASTKSR